MIRVLKVDSLQPEPALICIAAEALQQGKLVAFPTETVYGLGANALNEDAVARIFKAKGRPNYDPLIVHAASPSWLERAAVEIPELAWRLAEAFWPGPLTLILKKRPEIPDLVTADLDTVAVRVPSHPVALSLLQASGILIAAPSANRFGRTSPTRASHVMTDLGDRIDVLVDGGETDIGIESTVLDLTGSTPTILRPGGVTREQLMAYLGEVAHQTGGSKEGSQNSPGMLLQHYSPRAELVFWIQTDKSAVLKMMRQAAEEEMSRGKRVGILAVDQDLHLFSGLPVHTFSLGDETNLWQAARRLYAGMRSLDEQHVDMIFVRDPGENGPGLALRDRLQRASTKIVR